MTKPAFEYDFLLYGCYGYTGRLIAHEAVHRGMKPLLSGRNEDKVREIAEETGAPYIAFDLEDSDNLDHALSSVPMALHVAGPFLHTWKPMVEACIRTNTDYLDITGELKVFQEIYSMDKTAREADVMLLPGVGFDVVPTDCLSALLASRLENPTHLEIAISTSAGSPSRGTAKTMVEHLGEGNFIRRKGKLISSSFAKPSRKIDFGEGEVDVYSIPWGDLQTAWQSTGIENITVYVHLPSGTARKMKMLNLASGILRFGFVKRWLKKNIDKRPPGPDVEELSKGYSIVVAEITDAGGKKHKAKLRGPQGYTFTVWTALSSVERILMGIRKPGSQTPSGVFGSAFIKDIPGVQIEI